MYLAKGSRGEIGEDNSKNVAKNFTFKYNKENMDFYKNKIKDKKIYNVDHGYVGSYSNLEVAQEPEIKNKVSEYDLNAIYNRYLP